MKIIKTVLIFFGFYLIFKAYTLYSIYINGIDGTGIGIYLLGFIEINDSVPIKDLPVLAKNFALIGTMLILLPIIPKLHKIIYSTLKLGEKLVKK